MADAAAADRERHRPAVCRGRRRARRRAGALVADLARLHDELGRERDGGLVLIGRRDLRSNNSWMHNLQLLAGGTAHVHPVDAERLGLVEGAPARVRSRAGEIEVPVQVTEDVMPGVVSIPHGWGHDTPGAMLGVASAQPGVNSNATGCRR